METNEEVIKLQNDRSNVISYYTPIAEQDRLDNIANEEDRRDLYVDLLFKINAYLGVDSIIDRYWELIIRLNNNSTFSSLLEYSIISSWDFDNDVFDSSGALKTPYSDYITDNGYAEVSTNLIYKALRDFIGVIATETAPVQTDYDYATEGDAETARLVHAATLARTGSGILGTRTKNIDNTGTSQDPNPPNNWSYYIGSPDDSPDTPDYYDTDITIVYLTDLISDLTDAVASSSAIKSFYDTISTNDYIINKTIFANLDTDYNVYYTSLVSQLSEFTTLKSNLETWAGDLTGNRTSINNALITSYTNLGTYTTSAQNRIDDIVDGNTIFGAPNIAGTVNELRVKHLASLTAYPNGIIKLLVLLGQTATGIDAMITRKESELTSYLGSSDIWIVKPDFIYVNSNQTNDGAYMTWSSPLHCNKFKIYKRLLSEVTNNDEWLETYLIDTLNQVDDLDPNTLWTKQEYEDLTVVEGVEYVYRIKAIDDYFSTITVCSDSSSQQSDVYESGAIIEKCKFTL